MTSVEEKRRLNRDRVRRFRQKQAERMKRKAEVQEKLKQDATPDPVLQTQLRYIDKDSALWRWLNED